MAECRGFKNKLGTTIVSLIAKVTGAIAGNIATFNSDGELVDSGRTVDTQVTVSSDNLITSGAVYTELAAKSNMGHSHSIEDVRGLDSIITSLTERIRALEDEPVTESIILQGGSTMIGDVSYNDLFYNNASIFYGLSTGKNKLLSGSIGSLYDFAEVGSVVTLNYSNGSTFNTFSTIVSDKGGGPPILTLADSIPDINYQGRTITLVIKK